MSTNAHDRAAGETLTAAAGAVGRVRWVAQRTRVAPGDCLEAFRTTCEADRFYWERPSQRQSLAALGCAYAIEAHGKDRFREAETAARALFEAVRVVGEPGPPHSGPLLVGGFSFSEATGSDTAWSEFPAARLVLPSVSFFREGEEMWCTHIRCVAAGTDLDSEANAWEERLCGAVEPAAPGQLRLPSDGSSANGADPSFEITADRTHANFCEGIDAALRDIHAGEIEKVVLARSVSVRRNSTIVPADLLHEMRTVHAACTTFAVGRPSGVFLGATPEQLVRVDRTVLTTAAVAGSAPRGRNPEDDARLARELMESKKEQAEHAIVVRALRNALIGCCDPLEISEAPRLLRLSEIQHLETPIRGELRNGESILGLIGRMHPTPAVGGAPRAAAAAWIARHERLDRGWYAGPVGFVDADGGGDFCVALRSALVRAEQAKLYAGAGIVAGSRPRAELHETRLKLRALLVPLLEI